VYDLLVLGSGVAGLTTALAAARAGMDVAVVTKGELAQTATRYAQGGVAAALAPPDTPDLHLADTLLAGAGLCDPDAVAVLVGDGPERVRELARLGAHFDADTGENPNDRDNTWLLAREGGHTLPRVVHAGGDATGAEIERALVAAVARSAAIDVLEGVFLLDLLVDDGRCSGVVARRGGTPANLRAQHTVLATGGAGQCFAVTTNPTLSTGDGVAAALRAGVACADLEFMQFHPTALHVDAMPRPLLSEALRGDDAVLRDGDGVPFMRGVHPLADLAPRDVVSRTIAGVLRAQQLEHVWLDATMIDDFEHRFPTIWRACTINGLDPQRDWLPVAPAAHYLCGGVVTDLDGATTLPHLWACGEVACSGVHGANRLASNSLLDGLVFGTRVVRAVAAGKGEPDQTGVMRGVATYEPVAAADDDVARVDAIDVVDVVEVADVDAAALRRSVQRVMSLDVGVVRDANSLDLAAATLDDLAALARGLSRDVESYEARNVLDVARAIVANAVRREESRGAHTRADHPDPSDDFLGRFVVTADEVGFVPLHTLASGRANGGRGRWRRAR
jgi:L-aspartate oxidase